MNDAPSQTQLPIHLESHPFVVAALKTERIPDSGVLVNGRVSFRFVDDGRVGEIVNSFWSGTLKVNAREYAEHLRDVKRKIAEEMEMKRRFMKTNQGNDHALPETPQ